MGGIPNASGAQPNGKPADEFARFLDVPLKISIHIGRKEMKVRDILALRDESVFDLPKSAGENIEILVNGKLVAFGEVVEMEGNAGVRITDLHESN